MSTTRAGGKRVGTKPTAGVPHHPVVTRITFETTANPNAEPAEKYAAQLTARTVGHLEHVDVGAIVGAYLEANSGLLAEEYMSIKDCPDHDGGSGTCQNCVDKYTAPPEVIARQMLALTTLVETVLDEARATLRTRVLADLVTTLIPRLKGNRSV